MLMLRNRTMIGKLSQFFVPGSRSGVAADMSTSPRGPLDIKVQSPRGLRNYELGGVGLGIVAALEKSCDGRREILAKHALCSSSNIIRSNPKTISSSSRKQSSGFRSELEEFACSEDYTYVTCHGPNKTFAKVYCDGGFPEGITWQQRDVFARSNDMGQFKNSRTRCSGYYSDYPISDSLNSCHLCRKNLQGKDVYMYRGEKGFCSPECRSTQIMIDEHKEQCRSEVSRSADISTSPYTKGQIFSTGIVAI